MTALTEVFVTVRADTDKFGPEVKKKLARIDAKKEGSQVAGRFGVGFNGAFGGIVKHSAGLFVGAFAAIKGAQFLGGFINDARESAKVSRITAAVIKSTGGVAGITAAQIGDLATAISNKTGADDEAIQSGENLLATFTNVRNSVGKGNDVFNRATQAAVDMAAAMNGGVVDANGLKAANIQLGKALNDPVKGVTALSKVGVSFTAKQKEQIKTLVASGKTLEAQKIILGEVGKEFGGAAAAAADPLSRLQTIGGNLAEKVGGFLLPAVDKFATFIGDTAIPKISAFSDVFAAKVTPKLKEFGGFVKDEVLPRLVDFAGFFKDKILPRLVEFAGFVTGKVVPAVAGFVSNLVTTFAPTVKDVFGFFKTEVLPRLKDFAGFLGDKVLPKVGELATSLSKNKDFLVPFAATIVTVVAAMKTWAIVQGILNVVMSANPIGLVVVAIAALVGGLVYAYKHSEKFREIVDRVGLSAATTFVGIGRAVLGLVKIMMPALKFMTMGFLDFVGGILTAAAKVDNALGGKLGLQKASDSFNKFKEVAGTAFDAATAKAGEWDKGLAATQKTLVLKADIQDLESKLKTAKAGLADKNLTKERRAQLVATIKDLESKLTTAHTKLDAGWITKQRIAKLNADKKPLEDKLAAAKLALANPLLTKERKAKLNADKTALEKALREAQAKINALKGKTVEVKYTSLGVTTWSAARTAKGTGMWRGGPIRGPGGPTADRIPIMASDNEHMWTAEEVAAAGGHAAVESMRKSVLAGRGFAKGGAVRINMNRYGVFRNLKEAQAHMDAKFGGGGDAGPPGSRVRFRGVTLNQRTIRMLLNAERLLRATFHISQGSYSTSVAASGGTHSGGGAMDTNGPRGWSAAVSALRRAGFAAWHRTPAQGPWGHHIHSIALGDPTASQSAKNQMAAFRRGGDGLGHGMAKGGRVTKQMARSMGIDTFDTGGRWRSGTLAANTSGKTETVRTDAQEASLRTPIIIPIHIGDEVVRVVRGEIDASGEFTGTVGRMHR